jgi:DNA polymerase-3 subunit delta
VDVQKLIREAHEGRFGPVVFVVGSERFFLERAITAVRRAVVGKVPDAFNEEVFHGRTAEATRIVEAAKTLPMMARTRFVLVRGIEDLKAEGREALVDYLESPSESTCLLMTAEKLDGKTRLAKRAKKYGYWVDASPLKPAQLRSFAKAEAKRRGHKLGPEAAAALVDAIGNDLVAMDDALERLSLFVGEKAAIEADAVGECISRVRVDTIWALVDAVGLRDARQALKAAASLLSAGEPPLRILAMVARQLRMVARVRTGLRSGLSANEAAREAGAPGFKARELATAARRFRNRELAGAFRVLAETDLAMKSSRRAPETILQGAIAELTRGG